MNERVSGGLSFDNPLVRSFVSEDRADHGCGLDPEVDRQRNVALCQMHSGLALVVDLLSFGIVLMPEGRHVVVFVMPFLS